MTRRTLWVVTVTVLLLAAHLTSCAAAQEEAAVETAERGPALGAEAPGFTLEALDGSEVSLAGLTAEGPLVLVFFRGAW